LKNFDLRWYDETAWCREATTGYPGSYGKGSGRSRGSDAAAASIT